MDRNNIPNLLQEKNWTRYRLWAELGRNMGDRSLIYERLACKGAKLSPIPPATQWGTLKRVAQVLGVKIGDLEIRELEYKVVSTPTPSPNDRSND